jgi:triosephosphate isomerase
MTAMPRPLIAGNWKMNGDTHFAAALAGALADLVADAGEQGVDMLVCPPAVLIPAARGALGIGDIHLGGQDCHTAGSGAHTGDVSAAMLRDAGCGFVIVGHSERRADHGESDDLVRAKAAAAQSEGLVPIVCVGETLEERDAGRAVEIVTGQVTGSVPEGSSASTLVVAYEPVWAIGTGRTPTNEDIAEVHDAIRATLQGLVSEADEVRILYGGSVKPENASEILAVSNVNGALVGGASLKASDFWAIAQACP